MLQTNKQTNKQTKTHIFGWLKNQSKVQKTQNCRELPFLGCKPRLVANFCSSRTDKTKSELVQAAKEENCNHKPKHSPPKQQPACQTSAKMYLLFCQSSIQNCPQIFIWNLPWHNWNALHTYIACTTQSAHFFLDIVTSSIQVLTLIEVSWDST